jgi:hypothetical protein
MHGCDMSGCEASPEVKAIIRAMSKNRVESGITDASDLVDSIHEEIHGHTPLWKSEIADIISGYGEVRKQTKDEMQIRLAAIKSELRQQAKAVDDAPKVAAKEAAKAAKLAAKPTPEEVKNNTRRTQLTKEMADLQRKLDTGDFSKPVKNKPQYDEQTLGLQSERDALRAKADKAIRNLERANQSTPAKVADFFLAFRRAVILSSVRTIAKLTSAATLRTVSTPIEEGIGSMLRLIPGIRSIDAMAPREGGGLSLRAEAQAAKRTFSKETLKEMYRVATEGSGVNDALYGKDKDPHFKLFDWVGQIHGALKTPAKRNEFFRSVEKRGAFLRKQMTAEGKTPAEIDAQMQSPVTQAMLGAKAYEDSKKAIFMQDNAAVTAYRMIIGYQKNIGTEGSLQRAMGGASARAMEYVLPIVKIPTNFVAEAGSYAGGGAKALGQVIANKGMKGLTPEQADYIMRNLKKQAVGAALLAMGYFSAHQIGGYYQPGEQRGKDDPEAGGMKVWGVNVPKYLVHNPALEMLQIGATIRHIADSKKKGEGTIGAGVFAGAKGMVGEVPFFDAPMRVAEGLKTADSARQYLGENVRDALIPPDLQRYAKANDPEQVFKRKPDGFLDAIKTGIPGLREQVPLSSYKSLSLDKRMDAWDEMTPAQREASGMAAHIMASARHDASKLTDAQQTRLERIAEQAQ